MTTELTDSSGSNDLTFFRISGSSVVAGGDALFKLARTICYCTSAFFGRNFCSVRNFASSSLRGLVIKSVQ